MRINSKAIYNRIKPQLLSLFSRFWMKFLSATVGLRNTASSFGPRPSSTGTTILPLAPLLCVAPLVLVLWVQQGRTLYDNAVEPVIALRLLQCHDIVDGIDAEGLWWWGGLHIQYITKY